MAYLLIFSGNELKEQRQLDGDRITIGRAPDNDIVLASPGISAHHAVIERQRRSYQLIDLASANGLLVNGQRVERQTLAYWDEIRILDYVLKFRPRPRLPGEQAGELEMTDRGEQNAATMEVDVSAIQDLLKQRAQNRASYYLLANGSDGPTRHQLDKADFRIGRAGDCDVRTAGWFAPRVAARIKRQNDFFYVFPQHRGRTRINGAKISQPTRLNDGDSLEVRGLSWVFNRHAA